METVNKTTEENTKDSPNVNQPNNLPPELTEMTDEIKNRISDIIFKKRAVFDIYIGGIAFTVETMTQQDFIMLEEVLTKIKEVMSENKDFTTIPPQEEAQLKITVSTGAYLMSVDKNTPPMVEVFEGNGAARKNLLYSRVVAVLDMDSTVFESFRESLTEQLLITKYWLQNASVKN